MTKIVYNACYGGFSVSATALERLKMLGYTGELHPYTDFARNNPVLAQVVEELGETANGSCASLAIRELPTGTPYRIDEYDGYESVMTPEDYEWSIA